MTMDNTGADDYAAIMLGAEVRKTQKILILVSLYFLFATIYGTVKLIKDLLLYFGY